MVSGTYKPIVSVNICMYNGSGYIDETLRSVLAQTLQDFEIVVVDDGSTDGSPEFIEHHHPDPRITVVRQQHQTLRIARSVALAHSRGEYIAFLDSDDLWAPTKLERQVAVARSSPDAGLIFCDCELIDAAGRTIGRFSDQFDFRSIDLRGGRGYLELLRRGNFLGSPTPFAPAAALRALGGFNQSYQYVNDYDMWLRLARRYSVRFIDAPLAKYRIHETQFTQRHPDITLPEQCALLRPIFKSASFPESIRIAIGDNLLGQHRLGWRLLLKQRRLRLAARAALGMCGYPDRLRDSMRHRLSTTALGPSVETGIRRYYRCRNLIERVIARIRRAPRRVVRVLRGQTPPVQAVPTTLERAQGDAATQMQVWIDGSVLGRAQTGYFNALVELIRGLALLESPACIVHVVTQGSGRAALLERLGADGSRIRFHPLGWRAFHWSDIHQLLVSWHAQFLVALLNVVVLAFGLARANPIAVRFAVAFMVAQSAIVLDELIARSADARGLTRHRQAARVVRFLWRWLPAPRGRPPAQNTVEVLVWRGRFRWRSSRRIAIVQDMTTRIHPELHTEHNVREFDEFLGYVQRHAHTIVTGSEQSRQDIIDRISVCPDSVSVVPMRVHPQYVHPQFSRGVVRYHGICTPYVLCVGTIEPRKNLRRLVKAFESLKEDPAGRRVDLVIVGPQGWDAGFREFVAGTDASPYIRMLGFVPLEHLPSLYHFASAVICPSLYEGFGIPVLEAMCCSGIVLASRISSLPEVLGEDGMLFDPYSIPAIASALRRALTLSPSEEAGYRQRCRRRAELHLERLTREEPLPQLRVRSLPRLA